MTHPSMLSTVAGIKRALTPGTPVRIVNHLHPDISRTTTVHAKTNTVDLVTYATNKSGKVIGSHTEWPKKKQLRMGDTPDTFHVDHVDGETRTPFLTITVLDDAADVPAEYRAA